MGTCANGTLCFELVKTIPTIIIALLAFGITVRQWQVAKAKLKLDLFERRLKIFNETWLVLSKVVEEGGPTHIDGMTTPFNLILPEAQFLFGPGIYDYLVECLKNWAKLATLNQDRSGLSGEETLNNFELASALKRWFYEEATEGCKKKFDTYLDFSGWK